jgi:hypothetical protein
MTRAVEKLYEQASQLPVEVRAELAVMSFQNTIH